MTDTHITPVTPEVAAVPADPPFDRDALLRESVEAFAYLERRYDAARKRLERAKRAEDYLAFLITSKRALIQKLLKMGFAPEDIADLLLEKITITPVPRKKILAAIQKCRPSAAVQDGNSPQKRRGRPPKSAVAETADAVQASGQTGPIPQNSAAIATEIQAQIPANPGGNSLPPPVKPSAQNARSSSQTPASAPKQDSPERQQRFRKKAPPWVAEYGNHPQYGPPLTRLDEESDADYYWRMWHTAPPWSGELPRMDSDTETQWIQKCWLQTSPEERAAHQASLPSTAR